MNTKILNKLIEKQNLTTKEAKILAHSMMQNAIASSQIGALLIALRMKGETEDEIIGFIQAMREAMIPVDVKDAIDVCGTGGDGSNSFNISTAVALVVAGAGVKVAKHGNRAASSLCGSADVLEALGVNINLTAAQAKEVIKKVGMVFLFAPLFHPAIKSVAIVRKELSVRTVFNFLGPFVNPTSVKRQLIGIPNIAIGEKLIHVAAKLGYDHLVLVSSEDGMDEISLSGKTHVLALHHGKQKQFILDPKVFGFKKVSKKEIVGGTAKENVKIIKDILAGHKNAKRDIVVLNSAVALFVADKASDIPQGIMLAQESIDSGSAKKVLENLIKETQKYA